MDPLGYMIKDCWLHLFQFLSAMDKQALCGTCRTFQAMLEPEKTSWAFELILPHILNELYKFTSERRMQTRNLVLNLRQVCKSWKSSIDKHCEKNTNCFSMFPIIRGKYNFCSLGFARSLDVQRLGNFLTLFKDSCGNPFIGRSVGLAAVPLEDEEKQLENEHLSESDTAAEENENERLERERKERISKNQKLPLQLITKFGKEIHQLTLEHRQRVPRVPEEAEIGNCSELDAYKFLQFVLCNTPNLQKLNLSFSCYPAEDSTFAEKLTEYLKLNPLPNMTQLRGCILCGNKSAVNLLLKSYGGNLQSIVIYKPEEVAESLWSNMRSLRYLSLQHTNFKSFVKILQSLRSPLQTIYFNEIDDVEVNTTGNFFKVDKFLLAIQHLPLKKVTLDLISTTVKESVPFPRDFPKHKTIQSFVIRQEVFTLSIDFLQFLPQLECLIAGGMKIHSPVFRQLN